MSELGVLSEVQYRVVLRWHDGKQTFPVDAFSGRQDFYESEEDALLVARWLLDVHGASVESVVVQRREVPVEWETIVEERR